MQHVPVREFAASDILRIAEELRATVDIAATGFGSVEDPLMTGKFLSQEVEPGLLFGGYEYTYARDFVLEEEIQPSLSCGIVVAGEGKFVQFEGRERIEFRHACPIIIAHNTKMRCTGTSKAGTRSTIAGFIMQAHFFAPLRDQEQESGFEVFRAMFENDFRCEVLPRSQKLVETGHQLFTHPYTGSLAKIYVESLALAFVAEAARLAMDATERKTPGRVRPEIVAKIERAREIIEASIAAPPSLAELARQVGMNKTSLGKYFQELYGSSIFAFIRTRRLDVAKGLIRTREISVSEVGYQVGFSNPAAFTTAYRKRFGYPPSQEADS